MRCVISLTLFPFKSDRVLGKKNQVKFFCQFIHRRRQKLPTRPLFFIDYFRAALIGFPEWTKERLARKAGEVFMRDLRRRNENGVTYDRSDLGQTQNAKEMDALSCNDIHICFCSYLVKLLAFKFPDTTTVLSSVTSHWQQTP